MIVRIIVGRTVRYRAQIRDLGKIKLLGAHAEVCLRCRFQTVNTVAEACVIYVILHDLFLGVFLGKTDRDHHLFHLTFHRNLTAQKYRSCQLLRDRTRTCHLISV